MPTLYSGKAGAVELTVGLGQTTCAMSTKCHVSYAAVIGSQSNCVRYRTSLRFNFKVLVMQCITGTTGCRTCTVLYVIVSTSLKSWIMLISNVWNTMIWRVSQITKDFKTWYCSKAASLVTLVPQFYTVLHYDPRSQDSAVLPQVFFFAEGLKMSCIIIWASAHRKKGLTCRNNSNKMTVRRRKTCRFQQDITRHDFNTTTLRNTAHTESIQNSCLVSPPSDCIPDRGFKVESPNAHNMYNVSAHMSCTVKHPFQIIPSLSSLTKIRSAFFFPAVSFTSSLLLYLPICQSFWAS